MYILCQKETKAMEDYSQEALLQRLIRISGSPVSDGCFFIQMKQKPPCPCIHYRGLNTVTIKYRHPLPLVPMATEHLWNSLHTQLHMQVIRIIHSSSVAALSCSRLLRITGQVQENSPRIGFMPIGNLEYVANLPTGMLEEPGQLNGNLWEHWENLQNSAWTVTRAQDLMRLPGFVRLLHYSTTQLLRLHTQIRLYNWDLTDLNVPFRRPLGYCSEGCEFKMSLLKTWARSLNLSEKGTKLG